MLAACKRLKLIKQLIEKNAYYSTVHSPKLIVRRCTEVNYLITIKSVVNKFSISKIFLGLSNKFSTLFINNFNLISPCILATHGKSNKFCFRCYRKNSISKDKIRV